MFSILAQRCCLTKTPFDTKPRPSLVKIALLVDLLVVGSLFTCLFLFEGQLPPAAQYSIIGCGLAYFLTFSLINIPRPTPFNSYERI